MRRTDVAPSKETVIKAIKRVITVEFDERPDVEDIPGCCSMQILNGFPTDKEIEDTAKQCLKEYIEDRLEDDPKTNSGVMRELLVEKLKKFLEKRYGDCADLVILSERQLEVRKLALAACFHQIGSYQGKEGMIYILLRSN